jgi:hypothetical protein
MNKLYTKLLAVILFAFAIGGCKIDAPIYPEGTVPSADFLNGNAGAGNGGISNGSTITYTIDGKTITLKTAFFQVISPSQNPPAGNTQIGGGSDLVTGFSLTSSTAVAGTFAADIITVGTFVGSGTVTFTEINATGNGGLKGTVKGSFTGKVTDFATMAEKNVSGSFSIKM